MKPGHQAPTTALPKAMLVDLDGTIIDFKTDVESCWRHICAECATQLQVSADQLYQAIDKIRIERWDDPEWSRVGRMDLGEATRKIVGDAFRYLGIDAVSDAHALADSYRARRDEQILLSGAFETLSALKQSGVRLALLTNGSGPSQRQKVAQFALGQFFDCILIEGELGFGKPDERVYRLALKAMEASPADTWAVGDNPEWDVGVPQQLGMRGIWIAASNQGLTPRPDLTPDWVIGSLAELLTPSSI